MTIKYLLILANSWKKSHFSAKICRNVSSVYDLSFTRKSVFDLRPDKQKRLNILVLTRKYDMEDTHKDWNLLFVKSTGVQPVEELKVTGKINIF